jgi:hypothetical protein
MNTYARVTALACAVAAVIAVAQPLAKAPAQAPAPNTLTPAETAEGWTLLFDGRRLNQWRGFKMQAMPDNWGVLNGWGVLDDAMALVQVRRPPDIITVEQFGDFDFKFDWKLGLIPGGSNSGVMFYVTEANAATYHSGPEYQVLDNARHADGKNPLTTSGACYALYAPPRDVTRPIGEWNEGRIVANKGKVQHWLNGEKTADYDMNSDEWKAKVRGSKFKEWPSFGIARRGHIAIQQHGGPVAYRNLKIRRLDK